MYYFNFLTVHYYKTDIDRVPVSLQISDVTQIRAMNPDMTKD